MPHSGCEEGSQCCPATVNCSPLPCQCTGQGSEPPSSPSVMPHSSLVGTSHSCRGAQTLVTAPVDGWEPITSHLPRNCCLPKAQGRVFLLPAPGKSLLFLQLAGSLPQPACRQQLGLQLWLLLKHWECSLCHPGAWTGGTDIPQVSQPPGGTAPPSASHLQRWRAAPLPAPCSCPKAEPASNL